MAWALGFQGTCGPPLGSQFGLVRFHVSPLHGWEEYGLSEHGLVWWNLEEYVQKKANHLFHFELLPSLLGIRFDVWWRVHVVCFYTCLTFFLQRMAGDHRYAIRLWIMKFTWMLGAQLLCIFVVHLILLTELLCSVWLGTSGMHFWFWLVECMCMLNTRRVYVIHVICFAQGLFDLWPICSHIPSSLLETKFRA